MTESRPPAGLDRALDGALRRALCAPALPQSFRTHLNGALARAARADLAPRRQRFEHERREQLQTLQAEYVRIRRGTLVSLIGVACAAGAAATLAMPWLRAHLGVYAPVAITWGAIALGGTMAGFDSVRRLLSPDII